jgi:hypothetical protein
MHVLVAYSPASWHAGPRFAVVTVVRSSIFVAFEIASPSRRRGR